jgi:hypothetical protein
VLHRSSARIVPLLVVLQTASGCSFAFMNKAQDPVAAPNDPVDCTNSRAAPVLDTLCAGYFVVNAAALSMLTNCDQAGLLEPCVSSGTRTGGMLLSAGLAVFCAVSAGSGYGYASKCEDTKSLNALCITGDEPSCKKLNPAWVPMVRAPATAPPAPAAADPASKEPPAAVGCSRDTDCKGVRICVAGACNDPPTKGAPATAPAAGQ